MHLCIANLFCTFEYVLLFLDEVVKMRKATISFVMSVCPSAWTTSTPTRRDFLEIWYL